MDASPNIVGVGIASNWAERRRRRRFALALALALFAAYVGSYYHASRRGMQEAKKYNMCGCLYVPLDELIAARGDVSRHHALAEFCAPLNAIDRNLFGAPGPIRDIFLGLSK